MVTLYDVARKAGVSAMTVSRVIRQSPLISAATRDKVLAAIRELDYIPNKQARGLISKSSALVSLIITDISNPFFAHLTRGAEDKAIERGYQLLLANSDENLDKEANYIHLAISSRVDGVLVVPAADGSLKSLKQLQRRNVPFVLLDRYVDGLDTDAVTGDNELTIRQLVAHLLELGHTRIALINGPHSVSVARERTAAFIAALESASIRYLPELVLETEFKQSNFADIEGQLRRLPTEQFPTAIVAANNFIGVNTVRALRRMNIRIPEQTAVVCFDDPEPIPDYNPFLTVAEQPAYTMGYTGMDMLIERIEQTSSLPSRRISLPSRLLVRASSVPQPEGGAGPM